MDSCFINANRTYVDQLVINYVNSLFDSLFVLVHKHIFDEKLPEDVKATSKVIFDKINDVLYKSDDEKSKYATMELIWRRSYLLKELISRKSRIRDFDFNSEAYELFWFSIVRL